MRTLQFRSGGLVLGLLLLLSPAAFCENSATLTLQYDAYTDDASPETTGFELATPFQLTYARDRFGVTLQAAYARAEVSRDDTDFTISGPVDTFLNLSYTYPFPTDHPTKITMNLDLNLPTGKENLDAEQSAAESEPRGDLFRIDDFGEGLNVGATLGLERQIGGSTFGLYGGYTYYGKYDPRSDQTADEFDPGDEIFAGGLYEWKGDPRYTLQTYIGYSYFAVDTENGEDTLKIGDKLAVGTDLQASLLENLELALSLQYIFQFKSKDAIEGSLVEEPANSNGDELFGSLDLTYQYNPRFSAQLLSELRYYDESERRRADLDLPYEGRRVRYAIGSGLEYHITPSMALRGSGTYFYLDRDPNLNLTDSRIYQGVNLAIGVAYTF